MSLTVAESAAVIGDLRRARRRQRVAAIHWVDALYQVYITALVAVVALVFLSGFMGDGKVTGESLQRVRTEGPAVVGVLLAVAILVGLRSGGRGGPLALEQPDVRHVLLAPVDRGLALRGPAWRQLRFLAAAGAAVGAGAGQLALRRLPGNPAEWLAVGALVGVTVVGLGFGCALAASGTGLKPRIATTVGLGLVVWSVGDVAHRLPTAPTSVVGRLAVWPLDFDPAGLAGPVLAVGLVALGLWRVAGTSLEAAERRTALVGQLRFAVTLQDLRTVLVLRRQLAQERPRSRPWIRGSTRPARWPVVRRGVRSVMRWPTGRVVRGAGLSVVAGMALRGVWAGTTPLVVGAGIALWVAALDAVEPMGQEVDHPGRTDAVPVERGRLLLAHLPVVLAVSAGFGTLAALVAWLPLGAGVPALPAAAAGVASGVLAGCGAVVSTIQGAPSAVDVLAVTTPEIAGARTVARTAWPPGLAVLGSVPLLLARSAHRSPDGSVAAMVGLGSAGVVLVVALVAGWVRFHDDMHAWMRNALEQASPTKALERAAAEREAEEGGGSVEGDADDGDPVSPGSDSGHGSGKGSGQGSGSGGQRSSGPARRPSARPTGRASGPLPAAPEGVQGGTSAKPIGRKRDSQSGDSQSGDSQPDDSQSGDSEPGDDQSARRT